MTTIQSSSLKTILVHLDESPHCAQRAALAARLALDHGSHLLGLVPTALSALTIPAGMLPLGGGDFIAQSAQYVRLRAETLVREFDARMHALGLGASESRIADAESIEAVVRHGRAADLIVLGQFDAQARTPVGREFPEQVMLQAGRPVLLVPHSGRFEHVNRHALVAWRGTREAAVAVRDALPLLKRAGRVSLLQVLAVDEAQPPEGPALADAAQWLLRHGVRVHAQQLRSTVDAADVLLSHAHDFGADLLVMGGYGHARLREWVLGGVTRKVLAQMTVPVLMAH